MKQILIITFLILMSLPTYSYWAWACLIQDQTAEVLLDYKKINDLVIKNVDSAIANYNEEEEEWYLNSQIQSVSEAISNRKNETWIDLS